MLKHLCSYHNKKISVIDIETVVHGRWVGVERWLLQLFDYKYENVMIGRGENFGGN